jgi:predicted O-linked N-acetylglucosamine transferase (SPINDLY family)
LKAKLTKSRDDSLGNPGLSARAVEFVRKGAYASALPLLRRAMALRNAAPELGFHLARCHFNLGDIHAALRALRRAAQSSGPDARRAALMRIAICIPGAPRCTNAQILAARREWARLEARAELPTLPSPAPSRVPRRKLRIGYVSAFLGARNWMKPVWGMLDSHDRRAFEIHLFLDRGLPDRRHGYVPRKTDRIHFIDNLSNEAAARRIAAARIDVLVDLNAYSYPRRFGIFLRRPAPIQIGWFSLYATSGIDAYDYAIADKTVLPAREKRFCTEKILYVSGSYLAFSVAYRVPRVVAPPCSRSRRITFGCLAPQYKITNEVIGIFARILRAAPRARLLLKSTCMANAGNRAAIRARFLRHGISKRQLICEGPAEHFGFLKAYDRVDVVLDTFPYNGGTTTMEALWQGLPVLAFSGDRWASRISSSLLQAAGLGEWVRPSRQSFLRRAIALANSPTTPIRLSVLRATLRERLRASAACDASGLCRQLETHYRAVADRPRGRPQT